MELLTPSIGIVIWLPLMLVTIILLLFSWFQIFTTTKINPLEKLLWLAVTFMVPIIGAILFLVTLKRLNRANS